MGFVIFFLKLNIDKLFLKSKYLENMNLKKIDNILKFRVDVVVILCFYKLVEVKKR